MRTVQGMKTTATLLVGALLAVAPARADQAVGLQEDELQAIRTANRENKEWLPPLSEPFRLLLLNRPHEAVLVIIEPDGRFYYRGPDSQFLTVGDQPYSAQDYENLSKAIKSSYYALTLTIVRGRRSSLFQSSPQVFVSAIHKWDQQVGEVIKNEREQASLRSLLGRTVLELPEDSQKKVMNNVSEESRKAIEKAFSIQDQNIKAIKEGQPVQAPESQVRLLAGELSHLASASATPSHVPLRAHKGDPSLLLVPLETGKYAFIKAASPEVATDLASTGNLTKLAEMADKGEVRIYVDQGAGKAVEKVRGSTLRKQLKNIQAIDK